MIVTEVYKIVLRVEEITICFYSEVNILKSINTRRSQQLSAERAKGFGKVAQSASDDLEAGQNVQKPRKRVKC